MQSATRMEKLVVGVDVDGVVCDLHTPWLAAYNAAYGDDLTSGRCIEYDLAKFVKPACGRKIYKFLDPPHDLYAAALPIDGALMGVRALQTAGHRVVFVTSTGRALAAQKRAWLERHGFLEDGHGHDGPHDDLVFMSDKGLFRADVLIEDNPSQLKRFVGAGVLLDQPWNRDDQTIEAAVRIKSWYDVPAVQTLSGQPVETALQEAQRLVHGSRNADYGAPFANDARIAALMRALFGWPVQAEDVWQMMVLTKLSRERTRPKRDNRVDIAGYAEVGDWIHREKKGTAS